MKISYSSIPVHALVKCSMAVQYARIIQVALEMSIQLLRCSKFGEMIRAESN